MSQLECAIFPTVSAAPVPIQGLRRLLPTLALIAFAAPLFLYGLGDRDLTSSHEAHAAQNAQSILSDGDWLLPRLFDQHAELQKPPLFYWLVAAVGWLRGGTVDPWAVRLPSACAGLLCVLFLQFLGSRRGRPVAGFFAALCLASFVHFTWLARVGRIDMPLTCAVTLALGCFELGRTEASRHSRRAWSLGGYTAVAVGVLLKGPVALVLVGIAAAAVRCTDWRWPTGDESPRSERTWTWGVPWMLLLTLPWFLWINARTSGQLWDVFFWHHNIERGLGGSEALKEYPWWYYGPRLGVDLLPWILCLPAAAYWRWRSATSVDRDGRTGLVWFGSIAAFLSCMSFKRGEYLLPAYPGLALYFGTVAEQLWNRKERHRPLWTGIGVVLAGYAVGWLAYDVWTAPHPDQGWPYQRIAREIRRRTDMPVIFFRTEAHLLAYHVGRPLDTILEWENLQVWANREFSVYFVMPEDCARDWRQNVAVGELEEVLRISDWMPMGRGDRRLVVMRSRGKCAEAP